MLTLEYRIREHILHNIVWPSTAQPALWVKPALKAVEAVSEDEGDAEIDAPTGMVWPNQKEYMLAASVVRLLHLEDFVTREINDDDSDEDLEFYD
jgi:hypothetical protein